MGNSFGTLFRISTWGESHGGGIGVVIDGRPPRLPFVVKIQLELDRRRPGQRTSPLHGEKAIAPALSLASMKGKTLGTQLQFMCLGDHRPRHILK